MKTFKRVILVFLVVIVVFLIIGMFLPKNFIMHREHTIQAPKEMVFDQVNNLRQWELWSPWHRMDTTMKITYQNTGIGQGASYVWTSEKMGNGKLTILYSHEFDTLKTELDFGKQGLASSDYYFTETPNGIQVLATFNSDMGSGPIGRWIGLFMRPMMEKEFDAGLRNLDSLCKDLQKEDWFYVKVKTKEAFSYISLTHETTYSEIQKSMEQMYGALMTAVEKNGWQLTDSPIAIYHTWGETIKLECGLIIAPSPVEQKGIDKKVMAEQKYAVVKYQGPYEGLEKAHRYIDKFIQKNQFEVTGAPIEKYKSDPMTEPDPAKWVTYVMYPVK